MRLIDRPTVRNYHCIYVGVIKHVKLSHFFKTIYGDQEKDIPMTEFGWRYLKKRVLVVPLFSCICHTHRLIFSFQDLHVLDAGCGTGNYAKALIEFGVGKITLLDASKDMLAVAKEKLKAEIDSGIVDKVVEAKMPPLPFEDGSFDVVLFSLVGSVCNVSLNLKQISSLVNKWFLLLHKI